MMGGSPRPQFPGISVIICTNQPFYSFSHRITIPYFATPERRNPFFLLFSLLYQVCLLCKEAVAVLV